MSEKRTVLVIDDDEALCSALETKFSGKGYNVVVCKNGSEGCAALEQQKFDVILTDLHMPEIDGFDVLEKKKTSLNVDTPTYVITNLGSDQYCDRAIDLGAKKCFVKSLITLRDVVDMVDSSI